MAQKLNINSAIVNHSFDTTDVTLSELLFPMYSTMLGNVYNTPSVFRIDGMYQYNTTTVIPFTATVSHFIKPEDYHKYIRIHIDIDMDESEKLLYAKYIKRDLQEKLITVKTITL